MHRIDEKYRAINVAQLYALLQIMTGADIYSMFLARELRSVETAFPELIDITEAKNPPKDGAARQPYFGAIVTPAGLTVVASIRDEILDVIHETGDEFRDYGEEE